MDLEIFLNESLVTVEPKIEIICDCYTSEQLMGVLFPQNDNVSLNVFGYPSVPHIAKFNMSIRHKGHSFDSSTQIPGFNTNPPLPHKLSNFT